ncbi:MAG: mandelate racemase/muconate lactonizing enzyme family protein [Candidatus Brocadiae bacterium]|nr:mandelate racemase/muconate lactonizing enzyme family protein [Candidatus Brocadiia bacterium]
MEITRISTFIIGNPWKNWVIARVETDEGVTGLGEASGLTGKAAAAEIEELTRFVIGMDPREPARVYDRMFKGLFLENTAGVCAIEIACWDILGKSLGAPLWRLLGGKVQPRLRVYANGWYTCPRDPSAFAERASAVKEMGYTALKFDPFGAAYLNLDPAEEKLSLSLVRAVREAVGDEVDILVEGHDRFAASTAIRIGRALAEFRPAWFETPVDSLDVRATTEVARAVPVPVASGERLRHLSEFAELLAPRAVSIVQPEPLGCGGVGGAMKVAALAQAHGAVVACHQAQSPLCTGLNAHLHAAMPNFMIQECFDDFLEPWARDVLQGVPKVDGGYIEPSDAPGIGVELNEEEAAKHPYGRDKFIRLFEPGWESRRRQ